MWLKSSMPVAGLLRALKCRSIAFDPVRLQNEVLPAFGIELAQDPRDGCFSKTNNR
jgi:hypothetical protein